MWRVANDEGVSRKTTTGGHSPSTPAKTRMEHTSSRRFFLSSERTIQKRTSASGFLEELGQGEDAYGSIRKGTRAASSRFTRTHPLPTCDRFACTAVPSMVRVVIAAFWIRELSLTLINTRSRVFGDAFLLQRITPMFHFHFLWCRSLGRRVRSGFIQVRTRPRRRGHTRQGRRGRARERQGKRRHQGGRKDPLRTAW